MGTSTNCYTGDEWDNGICPDPVTCAANCALDGADYPGTYGINVAGDSASFKLVVVGPYDTNIGARTYVMDSPTTYKQYKVKNREFVFDVDVSQLPCGLNGALYFVDMDADGGLARFPGNKAGAAYGTGYCDAQCPHDDKFINGEANIDGWAPDPNGDPNSGDGKFGTCCTEMDIWEANSLATAITPHMCTVDGQYRCNGTECGDTSAHQRYLGVCDKDGCDLNPYRAGDTTFYGPAGAGPGNNGCNLQANINNQGTIMAPPTLETDPLSCCVLCNSTAGCAGFTYVEASSNCFLKSSLGAPIADAGATSGTRAGPPPAPTVGVDTTRPFTVVTQFKTADGTDAGALVEIVRFFVQDNVTIPHPSAPTIPPGNFSSVSDAFCKAKGSAWGDNDNFETFGGLARMGAVLDRGVTLVLSQWLDYEAKMLWLDSEYPVDAPPGPGVARGPCATTSGVPSEVIKDSPDSTVVFSKITVAAIGTTEARVARGDARV